MKSLYVPESHNDFAFLFLAGKQELMLLIFGLIFILFLVIFVIIKKRPKN